MATLPGAWRYRSALGLPGLVSVYCDWVRKQVWSATSISVWQRMQSFEQIHPWYTLACCWDVKQPTNNLKADIISLGLRSSGDLVVTLLMTVYDTPSADSATGQFLHFTVHSAESSARYCKSKQDVIKTDYKHKQKSIPIVKFFFSKRKLV